jgi:fructokinase
MHPSNLYICCIGETLWDMLPTGKQPGGAPMNVAVHLQNLGLKSLMISRIGTDVLGQGLQTFLQQNSLSTDFIQIDAVQPTGYVAVSLNEKKEASYDIVQPVAWDFIDAPAATQNLVAHAQAVVFSTLMARNEKSRESLEILLNLAQLKVYDVNFRPPHTPKETVEALLPKANIVKLNEDEFNIITSWYGFEPNIEGLKELIKKFNLDLVILTRGENGALVTTADETAESAGYKVVVADTIGSGDAFLAGFLKCYFEEKDLQFSVNYACALGALVASHHGATPKINLEAINRMLKDDV